MKIDTTSLPKKVSNYLVKDWFTKGGFSVVYGPSGDHKTQVATDLAFSVALGLPWLEADTKAGDVLYVAIENRDDIHNGLIASCQSKRQPMSDARLDFMPLEQNFLCQGDADLLEASLPKPEPSLIVIDRMPSHLEIEGNGTEKETFNLIENINKIRFKTGAHVMVIHNNGVAQNKVTLGSPALRAAVDTEIAVFGREIACLKQRDLAQPESKFFTSKQFAHGLTPELDLVDSYFISPARKSLRKSRPFPFVSPEVK